MYRVFFSQEKQCKSDCKYCFAKWNDIYKGIKNKNFTSINDNTIIIYPSCDCDVNIDLSYYKRLIDEIDTNKYIVFSISTKNTLTDEQIQKIIELKTILNNRGMVKLSVGFTSKYSISKIEPCTSLYSERILLLQKLKNNNIPTSVVLKPILPFISTDEYLEIIDDTKFINYYMIGGLYVNPNTDFYKDYIENNYLCTERKVNWNNNETWLYVDDKDKIEAISKKIMSNKGNIFQSDLDLIKNLISNNE